MGDDVDKSVVGTEPIQIKFISTKSPDYRLEFVNGAIANITPRGEIVCDFHMEFRDMPTEQVATIVKGSPTTLSPFIESKTVTRDVKFGIVLNVQFARDLVILLNQKINDCDKIQHAMKKDDNV
jgi:hypothetical protein